MEIYISQPGSSGLSGWSYRKKIVITGGASIYTNHVIMIAVNYSGGTDIGRNLFLFNLCQGDFDDIRFTKSDGTTLLTHWTFDVVDFKSAKFLVEVDSIAASPSTTDIYIHYGNSGASSGSSDTLRTWNYDFESDTIGNEPNATYWRTSSTFDASVDVESGGDGKIVDLVLPTDQGEAITQVEQGVLSEINQRRIYFKVQFISISTNLYFFLGVENILAGSGSQQRAGITITTSGELKYAEDGNPASRVYNSFSPQILNINSTDWYSIILDLHLTNNTLQCTITNLSTGIIVTSNEVTDGTTGGSSLDSPRIALFSFINEVYWDEVWVADHELDISISVLGTDTLLSNIKDAKCSTTLRGGGHTEFTILDEALSNLSTLKGYLKENISIIHGGKEVFDGILSSINIKKNQVIFAGFERIRVLTRTRAKFNPIITSGILVGTKVLGGYKDAKNSPWSTEYVDKFISIKDVKTLEGTFHLYDLTVVEEDNSTSYSPDATLGSVENCYFDSEEYSTSDTGNFYYAQADAPANVATENFRFKMWHRFPIKVGSVPTSIKIRLIGRCMVGAIIPTKPKLYIYNYTGAVYEEIFDFFADDNSIDPGSDTDDFGDLGNIDDDISRPFTLEFTPDLGTLTDHYIELQDATDETGFKTYNITILFAAGLRQRGEATSSGLALYLSQIIVSYDEPQAITDGVGRIETASTTELDLYSGTIPHVNFPVIDGISVGDTWVISDSLSIIMISAFGSSGAGLKFVLDMDTDITMTDLQDQTDNFIFQLLNLYSDMLGWEFWQIGDVIKVKSSFVSSEVTLTEADIENYNDEQFNFEIDAWNIRDEVIVKGAYSARGNANISPEYSTTDQTNIVNNSDIFTAQQANDLASKIASKINTNANKTMSFTIDLDRTDKNYSALEIGKTVVVKIPAATGTMANFVDGEDGELLIEEMHYFELGNRDKATLILNKR